MKARIVGNNTLQLNEATVIRALQDYLDAMATEPGTMGRVTSVRQESVGGMAKSFHVEVSGQATTAENS